MIHHGEDHMPADTLARARVLRFSFPRDRVIGDSQVRIELAHVGVLELETRDGLVGTGFFQDLFVPLPAEAELQRLFEAHVLPSLAGASPAVLLNRQRRPRGGNRRAAPYGFEEAVDQALWDLHGQALGVPLHRLLGGTEGRVRAYASGLDFHLPDDRFQHLFANARARGFDAFKIKVGHRDLQWDLRRLRLLRDAVGDATVMVDANEAWTPKEAVRRVRAYEDAGFPIFWLEDPVLRDDFAGLRDVMAGTPNTHVNTGEYLDVSGKRRLLEARALDMLNVHGRVSDVMRIGWLAGEHGIEVTLGNTAMELGVHLAVALPECCWMEYSFHNTDFLVAEPVRIEDGWAVAPEVPGHGLRVSDEARREFRTPGAEDLVPAARMPRQRMLLDA